MTAPASFLVRHSQ